MTQRNFDRVEMHRLFTLKNAAAYCGVCSTTFKREFTIRPINIGTTTSIFRYDRYDLDAFIDNIKAGIGNDQPDDWVGRLGR